ncbi:MAG: carbonic anhydrase family protein [Chloroflexi bacterium]|nr:carbonic anhydrase family protein [Chloroflexota bacterium]
MATQSVHWGYSGSEGPEHWGCLSDEYRPCSEGVEQSPVNIAGYETGGGSALQFSYPGKAVAARNNGHTVYLDFEPGNILEICGGAYELQGVHYHSPGEHEVDGEQFAAELHLVHQDPSGNLAVVGLLFRLGAASPLVQDLLDAAPDTDSTNELADGPVASAYVPELRSYFGYAGSLTTPPCSEGVRWIVMQSVGTVSQEQVDRLQSITGGPNNRPVQEIGARTISAIAG